MLSFCLGQGENKEMYLLNIIPEPGAKRLPEAEGRRAKVLISTGI